MKSLLLLLLLFVWDVNAFVYSCDEVKEIITAKTSITASNACVSLDEFISLKTGFATEVFIQDGTGKNKWSLVEVFEVGCVNSTSPIWNIVTSREDGGKGIDCDYEFTVLFTSIESTIVTSGNDGRTHHSYTAGNMTVIDPRGGILIDFACDNTQQTIDLYSGLGDGEKEEMFYMGSTLCEDRLEVWALDTAITVSIPDDGHVKMTHYGTGGYLSIGSTAYDMVIMGSGRANNLVQHGDDDKFLWLDSDFGVTFHIDGFYSMDPLIGNNIVLTALCEDNPCETHSVPLNSSSVHLSIDADLLSLDYYTKVGDSSYWRDGDSFFFRVKSTPLNPPPTPRVKVDTDYSCDCDLSSTGIASFSSSLWMDIVFIVDVSQSMYSSNLLKASSLIESIINSLTTDSQSTFTNTSLYSRVGLVAVSDHSEIVFDISTPFNSINLQPSSAPQADIGNGISTALDMFSRSSNRSSPQLIYVITASDSSSISSRIQFSQSKILQLNVADPFKNIGGIIAVTDVSSRGISSLRDISSTGYYNLGFTNNVNLDLQMICDANCFCPEYYSSFSDENDERQTPRRGCYSTQSTYETFPLAMDSCSSKGSILSTVHDDQKEFFLVGLISQFGSKRPFWIGYEREGDNWQWIDNSNSSYTAWASGQPDTNLGEACTYVQQSNGFNSVWYADYCTNSRLFVCERRPCSVYNYCD